MEFHEDIIFKSQGQEYGQELIEIINIKGKIVKVHQTEYGIIDSKMYKPDMVLELEDKIVILEFQSTYVDISDKRRFRLYSALFDQIQNKSQKDIEVHVLSTVEVENIKCYKVNPDSSFPINMKIVEDYAQRVAQKKVDERNGEIVRNMNEKGMEKEDIAILVNVSLEFVEQTLSK